MHIVTTVSNSFKMFLTAVSNSFKIFICLNDLNHSAISKNTYYIQLTNFNPILYSISGKTRFPSSIVFNNNMQLKKPEEVSEVVRLRLFL